MSRWCKVLLCLGIFLCYFALSVSSANCDSGSIPFQIPQEIQDSLKNVKDEPSLQEILDDRSAMSQDIQKIEYDGKKWRIFVGGDLLSQRFALFCVQYLHISAIGFKPEPHFLKLIIQKLMFVPVSAGIIPGSCLPQFRIPISQLGGEKSGEYGIAGVGGGGG